MAAKPKWHAKVGKRLLKHAIDTTRNATLREVRANVVSQANMDLPCYDCQRILSIVKGDVK